jgi:hypothetical protein
MILCLLWYSWLDFSLFLIVNREFVIPDLFWTQEYFSYIC